MSSTTNTRTEAEKINEIRSVIRQAGEDLRGKYPVLRHQSAIGMGIFLFAISGVVASGWAYLQGMASAWLCIPLVAFFTSLLHELEHDLIHNMYFKKHKSVQNFMLGMGWLLRPGTINPWVRKELHFLHHKVSGTSKDVEERAIGNGSRYGWLRFWVMADTFTGNLLKILLTAPASSKLTHVKRLLRVNFPVSIACFLVWYGFLGFHAVDLLSAAAGAPIGWSATTLELMAAVNSLVVVLIAPFYLRSFCLNFISSNMHYYGGVDSALKQTQVLNAWYLFPLQLFCFNFGSTHGIHHFVVGETFYVRQMTASTAHRAMRANGVRFNDLGTFTRANHFNKAVAGQLQPA